MGVRVGGHMKLVKRDNLISQGFTKSRNHMKEEAMVECDQSNMGKGQH